MSINLEKNLCFNIFFPLYITLLLLQNNLLLIVAHK